MKLTVLTSPKKIMGEYNTIYTLFDLGLETLHVRKPDFDKKQVSNFINVLPVSYRDKIILHGHPDLVVKYNLKGLHHTSNSHYIHDLGDHFIQTKAFHSLEEISSNKYPYEYAFLSPIFNSISKPDYKSPFSLQEVKEVVEKSSIPIYALGGINETTIQQLQGTSIAGVGILGAIWETIIFSKLTDTFKKLLKSC